MKLTTIHYVGMGVGMLTALAVLAFSLTAITSSGYGLMGIFALGLMVLGPLLALLAGLSLWMLWRKNTPGRVHALMWLPGLLAACIAPVYWSADQAMWDQQSQTYPPRREAHLNLSGISMTPDVKDHSGTTSASLMPGDEPQRALEFTRYPAFDSNRQLADRSEQEGYAWLYQADTLAVTADSMARHEPPEEPPSADRIQRYPLITTGSLPALQDLEPLIGASVFALKYRYYHYPDRTEVGAAISLAATQSMALEARPGALVQVALFNMARAPIARVQINGQEVDISGWGALGPDRSCVTGGAYVRLPVHGRWQVRWHTTEPPRAWRTLDVALPEFPGGEGAPGALTAQRVDLHFLPGRQIAVQRVQERRLPANQAALRATPLNQPVNCPATEQIDTALVRVLEP